MIRCRWLRAPKMYWGSGRNVFTALKQVNFLVETYEASSNKDSQVVKQTGGTGYYFRALIYYHLVTRWGGAPILRKRTYDVVPISPEADVWNFIKEDLGKAESLLSGIYRSLLRIFKCM